MIPARTARRARLRAPARACAHPRTFANQVITDSFCLFHVLNVTNVNRVKITRNAYKFFLFFIKKPGFERQLCPLGAFCPANSTAVVLCTAGTYCPSKGLAAPAGNWYVIACALVTVCSPRVSFAGDFVSSCLPRRSCITHRHCLFLMLVAFQFSTWRVHVVVIYLFSALKNKGLSIHGLAHSDFIFLFVCFFRLASFFSPLSLFSFHYCFSTSFQF